jgi:peptidoglycan hydrolase-like protein with peptidoglycan-binding domain
MQIYTGDEYRSLEDPINNEGPWAILSNPQKNYYTTRLKSSTNQQYRILMAVNHIAVGLDDWNPPDDSAEATARYGATTTNKASWHGTVDSDSIIPCLPDSHTAWAQGVSGYEFNRTGLALEFGARSTDWNSKPAWWVDQAIRNAAIWWAPRFMAYNLPLRYVTNRAEIHEMLQRGEPVGFTDHWRLDTSYREDPGLFKGVDTFPADMLLEYTAQEIDYRTPKPQFPPGRGPNMFFLLAEGADVTTWQDKLVRLGYLAADNFTTGKFEASTDQATRDFQAALSLTIDGVVGSDTQTVMDGVIAMLSNRISGRNRYIGAVEVSKFAYPNGAESIFLVGGEAVIDGVPAGSLPGPKLLVPPNSNTLPAVVVEEIKRLGTRPDRIFAVSGHVSEAQLHRAQTAAGLTSAV